MFFADFVIALRVKYKKGYYITKAFFRNTSFQCYHYFADPGLHWSERIFWFICIVLVSSYGILLMWRSVEMYKTNAINLTVDNLYLDWKNEVPAVIICDSVLSENHEMGIETFFEGHPNFSIYDLTRYADELVYYVGKLSTLELCMLDVDYSLPINARCRLVEKDITRFTQLRLPCEALFERCSFNGRAFNCCNYFQAMNTIYGKCYALNSLESNEPTKFNRTVKANDMPVLTMFMKTRSFRMFAVSREETLAYRESANREIAISAEYNRFDVYLKFKNTINDMSIRDIPVSIRKCRFPDENYLKLTNRYSYPACIVDQLAAQQEQLCGCTQYYLPIHADPLKYCTMLKQVICLVQNSKKILEKAAFRGCSMSCVESEVSVVGSIRRRDVNKDGEELNTSQVNIHFYPSRLRYNRRVIRDTIDRIVNVGGIGTLFFGASIISIIEIIYYFFIYPCNPNEDDEEFYHLRVQTPKTKNRKTLSYFAFKRNLINARRRKITIPFRN